MGSSSILRDLVINLVRIEIGNTGGLLVNSQTAQSLERCLQPLFDP